MPFPLQKNMHIGHEWRATALMLDEQFPMLLPCRSKSEVGQSKTCSVIVSGEHAARDDRQSYAYHFAMLDFLLRLWLLTINSRKVLKLSSRSFHRVIRC